MADTKNNDYRLFAHMRYDMGGLGFRSYRGTFNSVKEAKDHLDFLVMEEVLYSSMYWYQIVDWNALKIVEQGTEKGISDECGY